MFWKIIKEDLSQPKKQDPAYSGFLDVVFNYPGVWALINHRFAHFFFTHDLKWLGRIISGISRILTAVDIHPGATIGRNVFFDHATGIVIGETAVVGNNVLIYQGVTLGGVSIEKGKRHPNIEDGVVVGAGAKILGNITIGENSKVGANSVVVKDVPANCTAVGIPAKILGTCSLDPLAHNKIPDISKELFLYLIERMSVLECALLKDDKDAVQKDVKLKEVYESYINSLK